MPSAPEPSRFTGSATKWSVGAALLLTVLLPAAGALAQDQADLAKASQNPVAAMISLPFQNNTFFNVGPDDDTANVLNIQPVIPIGSGGEPDQPHDRAADLPARRHRGPGGAARGISGGSTFGLGDINYTGFLSPAQSAEITLGHRAVDQLPERDRQEARHREVERRAVRGRAGSAWPVRDRHAGPAALVVRRRRRPSGRQPAADPAVRELQHGGRLVPDLGADHLPTGRPIPTIPGWSRSAAAAAACSRSARSRSTCRSRPTTTSRRLISVPTGRCASPSRSCSRSERRRTR